MILKRKMYDKLLTLKNELSGKKAFLIEGARRIGIRRQESVSNTSLPTADTTISKQARSSR